MDRRQQYREQTRQEAKRIALEQLAEHGIAGISVNAIGKRMGVTGPALYRYFANRDALLTELISDGYHDLADTLEAAIKTADAPAARLHAAADAMRGWAVAAPHRYLLLFGTPVPGYEAPAHTLDAANRAMTALLAAAGPDKASGLDEAAERDGAAGPDGTSGQDGISGPDGAAGSGRASRLDVATQRGGASGPGGASRLDVATGRGGVTGPGGASRLDVATGRGGVTGPGGASRLDVATRPDRAIGQDEVVGQSEASGPGGAAEPGRASRLDIAAGRDGTSGPGRASRLDEAAGPEGAAEPDGASVSGQATDSGRATQSDGATESGQAAGSGRTTGTDGTTNSPLYQQVAAWGEVMGHARLTPRQQHWGLTVWTRLHGVLSLEVAGQFSLSGIDPALLFRAEVEALAAWWE